MKHNADNEVLAKMNLNEGNQFVVSSLKRLVYDERTVNKNRHLNDEAIGCFFCLLQERYKQNAYLSPQFLTQVIQKTKNNKDISSIGKLYSKMNIFEKKLKFIPYNVVGNPNH